MTGTEKTCRGHQGTCAVLCYILDHFSLNWPTGPIQSLSCNIHLSVCLTVCLSVVCATFLVTKKVLLLQFSNDKSPISQLQKDSLGNN